MALKPEERAPIPHIQCAHDMCPHSAIVAMWMPGLTRLCRHHYEFHQSRLAKDFCDKNGLFTEKQKRDYCLANMPSFRRKREPGQDDEEISA